MSHFPLHLRMYFLSVLHADSLSKVHLSLFSSIFQFSPVFSFWLIPPLWDLLRASALFRLNFCCCHLPIISVHFCNPSAAALTHYRFCTRSKKEEPAHLPEIPETCLVLGLVSQFLPFFSFSSFLFTVRKLSISFFAPFPPSPSSVIYLLLLYLLLLLPLLFLPLLLNTPPFNWFFEGCWVLSLAVCLRVPRSTPWLFSSKVLGSLPWLYKSPRSASFSMESRLGEFDRDLFSILCCT